MGSTERTGLDSTGFSNRIALSADIPGVSPDKIGAIDRLLSVRQKPQSTSMPLCDFSSKFRSIDGTCNSKEQAQYGKAGTIFNRLLNSNQFYNDGVETIRKSQLTGSQLPSARLVSATVLNSDDTFLIHPKATLLPLLPKATLLSIQWGQFLGHDLSHTPSFSQRDGSSYDCCSTTIKDGNGTSSLHHPECLPIAIRSDDPIYSLLGSSQLTCMNFIRSAYGNNLDGTSPGMRSQINSVTHWIDASHVYGSTIEKANELRDTTSGRGRLKTSVDSNGRQMLPMGNSSYLSYKAGDFRVNQHPLLTLLHTVWLREHNRIAENLYRAAPGKADEFYYQHARRILIALMQHITYNEYLPVMIGPTLAARIMSPKNGYLKSGNPAIFTEFSTAVFRGGHSQLRSLIRIVEEDVNKVDRGLKFDLRVELPSLESESLEPPAEGARFMDQALHGLLQTPVQTVKSSLQDDLKTQIFKPKAEPFDLLSLNIQRGRDHGLPSYTKMLSYFDRNNVPSNFDELLPLIPEEAVAAMRSVYESVDDVDLYVAGQAEKPLPNAALGPTFAGIFAAQFLNLRRTDRFFYDHNVDGTTGFSSNQLAEIQKVSLARIICDNSDGTITRVQPKAFLAPEGSNRPVSCDNLSDLPGINFSKMLPL
ncbi:hypothetical protein DAPPUDRAFT_111566 [Daphnia pulex]|uniref:Chorion peroxidase n=1 Tax=Daphnia pulex TaxID=6669 RepID=E9H9K5_DAPPU|nr:hypothetical protein DAPPUDRAFT_111566 [Daphnia pulex]|eukprot:EFX71633.1 hypothetical protein DAPPUDRAFT_111566 [Daphnia pulex]